MSVGGDRFDDRHRVREIDAHGQIAVHRHGEVHGITEDERAGRDAERSLPAEGQRPIAPDDGVGRRPTPQGNVGGADMEGFAAEDIGKANAHLAASGAAAHDQAQSLVVESGDDRGGARTVRRRGRRRPPGADPMRLVRREDVLRGEGRCGRQDGRCAKQSGDRALNGRTGKGHQELEHGGGRAWEVAHETEEKRARRLARWQCVIGRGRDQWNWPWRRNPRRSGADRRRCRKREAATSEPSDSAWRRRSR